MTQELQEVTTDYKIQLRISRTDYVSATNPKIYQFVAIRGSSGRNAFLDIVTDSKSIIIDSNVFVCVLNSFGDSEKRKQQLLYDEVMPKQR